MTQLRYAMQSCRRNGQTTALIQVLKANTEAVLVVSDANYRKNIISEFRLSIYEARRVLTLGEVDRGFRGFVAFPLWDNSAISSYEHQMGRNAARYERIVKLAQRYACHAWTGRGFVTWERPIEGVIIKLLRKWDLLPKVTPGYQWGNAPRGARK